MLDEERKLAAIQKILKEEYGITTYAELLSALAKQEQIDLAPFCAPCSQKDD